jgi:hydrogenase nickel incorporation protein HypB
MCETCGCGKPGNEVRILKPGEEESQHKHSYRHTHTHSHGGKEHSHEHDHDHIESESNSHGHNHTHTHENDEHLNENHDHDHDRRIAIEQDVISKNNLLAERNRGYFEAKGIRAINLVRLRENHAA